MLDPSSKGKLFLVDRTGSGESHILQMIGTMTGELHIIIAPLLALPADQMRSINQAVQIHTSTIAYHMDELSPQAVDDVVIICTRDITYGSSTTIFIFISPHFIAENDSFRESILSCRDRRTPRMIAIDEAHLYAMHGCSFFVQIRQLLPDICPLFTRPHLTTSHYVSS